ncbi:uncharacterized protein [Penaeus vannamei]|uniref:uncharacterized protein n=1 Tax=Penaeus vannamei TaxID=6689 RepID=UPI00387F4FF7
MPSHVNQTLVIQQPCNNHLISDRQYGFRKKRSASDVLMSWSDVPGTGRNTIVIGLDIAGAFDRVWHGGLLSKFTSLGISGDLHTPLRDHLRGRTLSVVKDHQSKHSFLESQHMLMTVLCQ